MDAPHTRVETAPALGLPARAALRGDRAWLVETGYVDLFAAGGARLAGRRHYLGRAIGGDTLLGLSGDDVWLEAACADGARLVEIESEALVARLSNPETSAALDVAIGRWVDVLAEVAADARPRGRTIRAAGDRITAAHRMDIQPSDSLVWIRVLTGSSYVCGNTALAIGPGGLAPVSPRTWLAVEPGAQLELVSTADLVGEGHIHDALAAARSLWTRGVRHSVERRDRVERERQRQTIEGTRRELADAFARIASSYRTDEHDVPIREETDSSRHTALVAACRSVAQAMRHPVGPVVPAAAADMTPKQAVEAIADAWGLRVRQVLLRDAWWRCDQGPLLAFTHPANEPVAVVPAGTGRYRLIDPHGAASGAVTREVAGSLGPVAFAFYRTFTGRTLGALDLVRAGMQGCGRDIIAIVLMGSASGLLASAVPIATGILVDSVVPGAVRAHLLQWTLLVFACAAAAALLQIARGIVSVRIEMRVASALQPAIWDRVLRLPLRFFRQYSAGALAARAMSVESIRQILTGATLRGVLGGVFSLFNLALLFHYNARAAVFAVALLTLLAAATVLIARVQLAEQHAITRLRARTSGIVLQLLNGIAKVRVAGAEVRAFGVWARLFSEQRRHHFRFRLWNNVLTVVNTMFPIAANIVLIAVLTESSRDRPPSTGDVLAFMAAFTGCVAATFSMTAAATPLMYVMPLYEMTRPILQTLPEVSAGERHPGVLSGEIAADRLMFQYSADGPPILQDVSFRVRPGQFVAFVGPTGSGKSTILRLLLGFETPQSGAVYFDGLDLQGLDIRAVRQQIGVVLQTGRLIPGDIYTNIVGCTSATLDDAWEAARMVGLDDDITRMPMGMHTVVTEGGSTLSGGQRQRVMIARAIVSRPRILLFDEATSSLDNRTQAVVSRSLKRLQATRLVIAHRLSTVVEADCIFVVRGGRIVQTGPYADLIGQPGLFAELARLQVA